MIVTLKAAVAPMNLFAAWFKVEANHGCAGVDGLDLENFEKHLQQRLDQLMRVVLRGAYKPDPLMRVMLEEAGRRPRYLAIPTVRDRVLQTAVALLLTPILDEEFEHCSYAYRAGRSRFQALARIAELRDAGYRWVVDADISAYFDEVDQAALLRSLARFVTDQALLDLVQTWLRAPVRWHEGDYCMVRGIPQGSPLSPLLANLYLDTLDEALLGNDLALVRYSDDFVILCRNRGEAEDAMQLTAAVLEGLSLRLNAKKTRVTSFSEGFRFLGAAFLREEVEFDPPDPEVLPSPPPPSESPGRPIDAPPSPMMAAFMRTLAGRAKQKGKAAKTPRAGSEDSAARSAPAAPSGLSLLPASAEQAAREVDEFFPPEEEMETAVEFDPLLRTLHLLSPGLYLSRTGGRFLIRRGGVEVDSVPAHTVNQIVLHGNQAISTGVLEFAADQGVNVQFQAWDGACYGMLYRDQAAHVALHRRQFERDADPVFQVETARAIVEGKIRNQRLVLRRYQRNRSDLDVSTAIDWLGQILEELVRAGSVESIRGYEGAAARAYYSGLAVLLGADWRFSGRTRRPPRDPVNAMLSYGYGVLQANVLGVIGRHGLYPYLGVLHTPHHGQPALASDLMEEFRPLVVDSVVLRLVLSGSLRPESFQSLGDGCTMDEAVKKALLRALEAKLNARLLHPRAGIRMDYRRAMQYQAQRYAQALAGENDRYAALMPR